MNLMRTIIFLALISLAFGGNTSFFQFLADNLERQFCPYNGVNGAACQQKKFHSNDGIPHLPVMIGVGYDPLKGEVRLPVLSAIYSNQIYVSGSGKKYLVPDEYNLIKENLVNPNLVTATYSTLADFFSANPVTKDNIISGIFSQSPSTYQEYLTYFGGGQQTMIAVTDLHYAFNLQFSVDPHQVPLNELFIAAVNYLPAEYDPQLYGELIDYWGTHVVTSGYAGGSAQQINTVKTCFSAGVNLADQAQLNALKQLYATQYANINFAAGYQQRSQASSIEIFGGDPTIVNLADWNNRVASFDDNPVLVNVAIVPITEFISDPTIKANLQKAINTYLAGGVLEMNNILNSWNTQQIGVYSGSALGLSAGDPVNHIQVGMHGISQISLPRTGGSVVSPVTTFPNCQNNLFCYVLASYYGTTHCSTDATGMVTAEWDASGGSHNSPLTQMLDGGAFDITVGSSTPVRYGCTFTVGYGPYFQGRLEYRHYCCAGCNPVMTNINNGWGNLECDCPTF